jgi:hypothetical protein
VAHYTELVNSKVPDGNYIAEYTRCFYVADGAVADFLITTGPLKGNRVSHIINSKRAQKKEVPLGRADIIEWLSYCGDAKASRIYDAIINHIDNKLIVKVQGGLAKSVKSATQSERTFNSFMRILSVEWTVRSGHESQPDNLRACKDFYRQTSYLPKLGWPTSLPNEKRLRRWLDAAIDPTKDTYFHDASLWINSVFSTLATSCGYKTEHEWPLIFINKGFDAPPPRSRQLLKSCPQSTPSVTSPFPQSISHEVVKSEICNGPVVQAQIKGRLRVGFGWLKSVLRSWLRLM